MKKGHRSGRRAGKPRSVVLTAFCVALAAILLGMGVYVAQWYLNLGRIRAEGERYASLYGGREATPAPQGIPSTGTALPAERPTAATLPAERPTGTALPTEAPTPTPSPTPVPAAGPDADMPVAVDEPIDTTVPITPTPTPLIAAP